MADADVERWQTIDRLCTDALQLEPHERSAFLERETAGDETLRRDVQALLESDEAAGAFLERPALQELAEVLASSVTSLIGQEIGGYRIDSLIGAGGMGDVYRARDLKLERDVALKVLERATLAGAGGLRRFEDEARAASALNHPNIVTIYGVGEARDAAFIAMELVNGSTLRATLTGEPSDTRTILDIAVQLADALAAAHARGIVHRDLKPENVMVTPEGRVKVLDFGIAGRLAAVEMAARTGRDDEQARRGGPVVIMGTAGYMAPEQADGAVDHRSDQFAFGAILYELITGRRAFERATTTETLAAIRTTEPEPITPDGSRAASSLAQVVSRCLAKKPSGRYGETGELAARLREIREQVRDDAQGVLSRRRAMWLTGAAVATLAAGTAWVLRGQTPAQIGSLAVLPFANETDDDIEYLCQGLAESLIYRLKGVPGLTVKAFAAVTDLKRRGIDGREAGRRLGADVVLTGRVSHRAQRLIVDAEMMNVADATRIWGEEFTRPMSDVLALHDELAAAIVRDGIGDHGRSTRALTSNPRAYDLYLQAVHHFRLQDESHYLTARNLLTEAIAHDAGFALAHVTLASTFSVMAIDGYEMPKDAWPRSEASVARALELDAGIPDAYAEGSAAAFYWRWDWDAADRKWQMALDSLRGDVQPELLFSRALQMWALGDLDAALRFARDARRADPLSAALALREADLLVKANRPAEAVTLYDEVIEEAPDDDRAYHGLAEAFRVQGRFDEGIDTIRTARAVVGEAALDGTYRGAEGFARQERESVLGQLEWLEMRAASGAYTSPLDLASVYARLGQTALAFEYLNRAFDERSAGLVFLRVGSAWETLRGDRRFDGFVSRLRLPAGA